MANKSLCKMRRGSERNDEISLESVDSGLQDQHKDVEEGTGKSV